MPKVNVYLSDDLAAAVKEAGVPLSAVCQRALEDALRAVATLHGGSERSAKAITLPLDVRLPGPATPRLIQAIQLAYKQALAGGHAKVTTAHLILGMLDEADNLGVRVLRALDIESDDLRTELRAVLNDDRGSRGDPSLDEAAAAAIDGMRDEAVRLTHNYLGCEHLLLAVIVEADGNGGRVLRSMGVDITVARRAVATALAGFIHGRANPSEPAAAPEISLRDVAARLERIESLLSAK